MTATVRDCEHYASLRRQASRGGRAIDGGAAFTPVRDNVLLALLDLADASVALAEWGSIGSGHVPIFADHKDAIRAYESAVEAVHEMQNAEKAA